jgi:hypothetical protein
MSSRRHFIKQSTAAGLAFGLTGISRWLPQNKLFSYRSDYINLQLSGHRPLLLSFSTDSLGKGQFKESPLLKDASANNTIYKSVIKGDSISYHTAEAEESRAAWQITCQQKGFTLRTMYKQGDAVEPFAITFAQKLNHCTVLGVTAGEQKLQFPCVMHLPGMGTFRIHCNVPGVMMAYDAFRGPNEKGEPFVQLALSGADATHSEITYRFESVAIYPNLPGIRNDARFDGFRRNYINIFQLNPRIQSLANNSASDACAFTLFLYAEMARKTPPLAAGLTAMDLVRNSLNQYLGGMKAYGQVGYHGNGWQSEYDSTDSAPSLIMAACYYALDTKDRSWITTNYAGIKAWAHKMMATDKNNDGIIEYGYSGNANSWSDKFKRPANWWDTIGFGHNDAYSNILAYRACILLAQVTASINKKADSDHYKAFAALCKKNFYSTFYNPATGILGGWRSEDGVLHDYYFLFVNSMAITYDLVDAATGKKLMNTLLAKMKEVGYTNFSLGLPGNLLPVADADYTHHDPRWGYQKFQVYENGGATGCYAYYTIHALFKLGMRTEAEAILFPMLESYTQGGFEGHCAGSEFTKDWKTWNGECWGYEGFLVDNYLPFLAVHDWHRAK